MFQQKETFLLLDLLTLKDFKDALKIRTSSKRLSQVIAYHVSVFLFLKISPLELIIYPMLLLCF